MPPITKRTAWIYGSMSLPIAIISYPLAVWIPRLYSTEIGLNLTVIGMVIFAAAIFDAISDPAMGFMSDRFNTVGVAENLGFYLACRSTPLRCGCY